MATVEREPTTLLFALATLLSLSALSPSVMADTGANCSAGPSSFVVPPGCQMEGNSPDCEFGVTFTPTADCQQVQIDLVGQALSNGLNSYVAVGLSSDTSMGNDYVTECSSLNRGLLQGRLSYNVKSGNIRISGLTDQMQSQILTTLSTAYVNGRITCTLLQRLQPPAGAPSQVPTLSASSSFHLLLARGATSASGLQKHADASASSASIGLLQGQSSLYHKHKKAG